MGKGKYKPNPWEHNPKYKNHKGQPTNHHISIFESFVYSPVYRVLSPSALKVYNIIAMQYSNRPEQLNGLVKCPYRDIEEKTDLSSATVSKAIIELEKLGVIQVNKQGGFGIPSEYILSSKWQSLTIDQVIQIKNELKKGRKNTPP